jgi:tRNA modification GTPase
MMNKLSGWDDTIIALATAPGLGAIAVLRITGNQSFEIINGLFTAKNLLKQATHTLHVGMLKDGEKLLDEVVLALFKGPKSFTGEDTIEISCHGSTYVQQQILEACIARGARLARAGEFTQRAFLNGKMDLTQAEAVADIIAANTEASTKAALYNIRGGFSHELSNMREQLIAFSALIELELDFATEDVEFADREKFYKLIEQLSISVNKLIASFTLGNVIKNGVSVAIIGKPNAGKSTLLNVLLNEDRAIVSAIAGTTRDTIEEIININGILFRLIDTAGIRTDSSDIIEKFGIEKSLAKMRSADIVLYIFDVNTETLNDLKEQQGAFESENIKYILAGNKSDTSKVEEKYLNKDILFISARQKEGIDDLKQAIFTATVEANNYAENNIVTNTRHLASLKNIAGSLTAIKDGLTANLPGDLLSPDIRTALYDLGEITGEVTNEDKLNFIFSKFCIGK